MNRSIAAAFAVLMLVGASEAWAQQRGPISKKLLVGNWAYVRAESVAKDGTRFPLVEGANPKGLLVFDGIRFSLQIMSEFPKLASNDRLKTTPEENKAVAHGVLSYYGTYSLIERVGFYDPKAPEGKESLRFATDRLTYWRGKGAQLSPTVARLLKGYKAPAEAAAK